MKKMKNEKWKIFKMKELKIGNWKNEIEIFEKTEKGNWKLEKLKMENFDEWKYKKWKMKIWFFFIISYLFFENVKCFQFV